MNEAPGDVFTHRPPVQCAHAPAHSPPRPSVASSSLAGMDFGTTSSLHRAPFQCSTKPREDFLACQANSHTLAEDCATTPGAPPLRGAGMDGATQARPFQRYAARV